MTPSVELLVALGPVILLVMAFLETAIPLGLLVPAGVSLSLAAFLAHQGLLPWEWIVLAAGVGALAGDSTGYWLGRRGSLAVRQAPGWAGMLVRKSRNGARRILRGPPILSVTLARLASFVRTLMPATAGMGGMTYLRFLAYDIPGVLLWLCLYVGVGVVAGESWRMASGLLGMGWAVIIVLALVVGWGMAAWRGRAGESP